MIGRVASSFTAVLVLGRGVCVLGPQIKGTEPGSHAYDSRRPDFEAVRVAVHCLGLDGPSRGGRSAADLDEV